MAMVVVAVCLRGGVEEGGGGAAADISLSSSLGRLDEELNAPKTLNAVYIERCTINKTSAND